MLHLVDKKYLEVCDRTHKRLPSIVLNEKITNSVDDKSLFFTLTKEPEGKVIHSSKNLDEAIEKLGGVKKFLQFIIDCGESTLEIYCDYEDYLKLSCVWLKSILPNLTVDSFKKIIITELDKRKYIERILYNVDSSKKLKPTTHDELKLKIDQQIVDNLTAQLESIDDIWKKTKAVDIKVGSDRLSYEFQYARYLLDGDSWSGAEKFKKNIVNFILDAVITDFIEEFKCLMLENVFNLDVVPEFQGFDPLKHDLKDWMGENHTFNFMVDNDFRPGNIEYIRKNYDLVKLADLYTKYTVQPYHLDIRKYMTGDFDVIMDHEFNNKFGLRYLGVEHQTVETSSSYLFLMLYNLSKMNRDKLKEFAI